MLNNIFNYDLNKVHLASDFFKQVSIRLNFYQVKNYNSIQINYFLMQYNFSCSLIVEFITYN